MITTSNYILRTCDSLFLVVFVAIKQYIEVFCGKIVVFFFFFYKNRYLCDTYSLLMAR